MQIEPKRCLVLNRWDDDFAAYDRYIDHSVHKVAYISTPKGATALRTGLAKHIEIVPDFKNLPIVLAACRRCEEKLGGIDKIMALSEFDLITAGELRAALHISGDLPTDVARYRDKTVMKQSVLDAGLRAPSFAKLDDAVAVERLIATIGFPLMVKPRAGAASVGCYRIESKMEFDSLLATLALDGHECEEFVDGPIFHVDGLVANGEIKFAKVSRYINTCYDFAKGKALGSILLNPGDRENALREFADKCLSAIGISDSAFHLEIIGDKAGLCFLEVGARVGGGEIPFLMRDLFGLDFFEEWVNIEFGGDTTHLSSHRNPSVSGGFLMLPEPVGKCLLARSDTLIGQVPGMYQEVLPPLGHHFDGSGGYDHILGRFRFRGPNEAYVEAAIAETLRAYAYTLRTIDSNSRKALSSPTPAPLTCAA